MKSSLPVVLLLASLVPSLALAQNQPPAANRVVWRDERTKQELFSSADVLAYDPSSYLLLLNEQKTHEFAEWGRQNNQFEVIDQDGVIYSASLYSSTMDFPFMAPTYRADFPISIRMFPMRVSLFKPTAEGEAVETKRWQEGNQAAERLKNDLKGLGLIHTLSRNSQAASDSVSLGWQKVNSQVSVWPSLYDRSLKVGQSTWVSLFFSFDGMQTVQADEADQVTMELNMVANAGKFNSRTLIGPIDVPHLGAKPVMDFQFDPWKGLEGSQLPTSDGSARLSVSLLFQKKGKTIARQSFDPVLIVVNAPKVADK